MHPAVERRISAVKDTGMRYHYYIHVLDYIRLQVGSKVERIIQVLLDFLLVLSLDDESMSVRPGRRGDICE